MLIVTIFVLMSFIGSLYPADSCSTPTARGLIDQQLVKMLPATNTHFTAGHLQQFDAQVGEGGCHLRALKLYGLYKSFVESPIADISAFNPDEQQFLVLSHILTMSKHQEKAGLSIIKETIDEKILKSTFNLSSRQADSFKRVSQRDLATLSIQFAKQLPIDNPEIKTALSYERPDSPTFRRPTVGCFPSMCAIMDTIQKKEIPCALRIIHTCKCCVKGEHLLHCLLVADEDTQYHCIAYHDEQAWHGMAAMPQTHALVLIEGKSIAPASCANDDDTQCLELDTYLKKITHLESYTTMLKAAAAASNQFTGELIHEPFPYDHLGIKDLANQHERLRSIAHHHGFSEENPSVFVTQHMSCCTMQELPSFQ